MPLPRLQTINLPGGETIDFDDDAVTVTKRRVTKGVIETIAPFTGDNLGESVTSRGSKNGLIEMRGTVSLSDELGGEFSTGQTWVDNLYDQNGTQRICVFQTGHDNRTCLLAGIDVEEIHAQRQNGKFEVAGYTWTLQLKLV